MDGLLLEHLFTLDLSKPRLILLKLGRNLAFEVGGGQTYSGYGGTFTHGLSTGYKSYRVLYLVVVYEDLLCQLGYLCSPGTLGSKRQSTLGQSSILSYTFQLTHLVL